MDKQYEIDVSLSEAVMVPQDTKSGIYDATGRLVLAAKGDGKAKVELFAAADLTSALRDLAGSPYTVHLVTATSTRSWGVFSTAFQGGGTMDFTGAWSPDAGPVGACYTEWNPGLAKPHIGAANFQLWSVEVGSGGAVRVIGTQPFGLLNTAAGIVIPL